MPKSRRRATETTCDTALATLVAWTHAPFDQGGALLVQRCFLGSEEGPVYSTTEHPNADFDDLDGVDVHEVLSRYLEACDASRAVARTRGLDETASVQRQGQDVSLRYIAVHMVDEYARHLGHADLLREAIDGSTGG